MTLRFDWDIFWRVFCIGMLVFYQCWIHFAALIRLRDVRAQGLLNDSTQQMGTVALFIGYWLDNACMWMMSLRLLDAPRFWARDGFREMLLSHKLTRLTDGDPEGKTWRGRLALDFRRTWLDNVDSKGIHRG